MRVVYSSETNIILKEIRTRVNCGGMAVWYNGAGDVPTEGLRDTGGDGDTLSS